MPLPIIVKKVMRYSMASKKLGAGVKDMLTEVTTDN